MSSGPLPRVVADGPLGADIVQMLAGRVALLDWSVAQAGSREPIHGMYTYGHPVVDGAMMDRLPGLKVISNYGVGVDHVDLAAARQRGIPVGNTPGVLDGATADLGFALLLASARRLVEGDRYARGPDFLRYDPANLIGREVHGKVLGIIGMGRIGRQVARRARGFDMAVLYHNRNRRSADEEQALGARYATLAELLAESDFVMLTVPLSAETAGMIGSRELAAMKLTATLINVARGPIVDTQALYEALRDGRIAAAAVDVTDPEPLPRDHPLLRLENLTITPHLGSASRETRQRMAEISVENLLAGLASRPLRFEVL
jgi:glyoxylate reductase